MNRARTRTLAGLGILVWFLAVASLTLGEADPIPVEEALETGFCLVCGDRGTADAILNVILFLPLGFMGAALGLGWAVVTGLGAMLSGGIELAQQALEGRYATAGDVVFNAGGTFLGWRLWHLRRGWLIPEEGRGRRATRWATLFSVTVFFATGLLLSPHHTNRDYWGQWTADLGYLDHYDGEVLEADLNGIPIPSYRIPQQAEAKAALEGNFQLSVDAVAGFDPVRIAPILSIYDGGQQEIVLLGTQRNDLVWRERTYAKVWRMDQPDLRIPHGMAPVQPGDTVHLGARRAGFDRCLEAEGIGQCGLGFTPGSGWGLLLYPESLEAEQRRALDVAWLILLFAPLGFLPPTGRIRVLSGAAGVTGIGVAVLLTRLLWPPWWEWVAVVAAVSAGWLLRNRLVAWQRRRKY